MSGRPGDAVSRGRLDENLMHFARLLRRCGFSVGPGRTLDALRAVGAGGIEDRSVFYWTLHAVFVNHRDQRELFDQAFHVFWRNPGLLDRMPSPALPATGAPSPCEPALSRRVSEALAAGGRPPPRRESAPPAMEIDAALTWSADERLRKRDFEQMSAEEAARARTAMRAMRLPLPDLPVRRRRPHPHGERLDPRATFRASMRRGGGIELIRARRRRRPPAVVILCDVSGSMSRYSRMLLHFVHAITNDRDRVFSFVFGTRLTNVTRQLRGKDVDDALARVASVVDDWGAGTRIGSCIREFNLRWSRRILGQGALVLLITDGLDRDAGEGLSREMQRLSMSSRKLVWLNPLMRYDRFEPKALGMRAMLPHVDEMRPVHNLESLESLVDALRGEATNRRERWPNPSRM